MPKIGNHGLWESEIPKELPVFHWTLPDSMCRRHASSPESGASPGLHPILLGVGACIPLGECSVGEGSIWLVHIREGSGVTHTQAMPTLAHPTMETPFLPLWPPSAHAQVCAKHPEAGSAGSMELTVGYGSAANAVSSPLVLGRLCQAPCSPPCIGEA